MNKKIVIYLGILLISLLAISTVSASEISDDINDDLVLEGNVVDDVSLSAFDDGPVLEEDLDNNLADDSLAVSNDESKLSADYLTFTDLNNTINGNNDSEIYLNHDYKWGGDPDTYRLLDGIDIHRDMTIYGNGHTINGAGQACIFVIHTEATVQLVNLKFTNAYNGGDGGAVLVCGNCTAINCTFSDNEANYGGGLYEGIAINCTFKGNKARYAGGMYGGTAINCRFEGNSAITSGGAMEDSYAINCTFKNNQANYYGGALSRTDAVNCTFEGNEATNAVSEGGAMHYGNATNCNFTNNKAENNGGAIYGCNATNCTFISNIADNSGGAIYEGNATNCYFWSNEADDDDGGAMYGGTAVNCYFNGNKANDYGGAMYKGTAFNCSFMANEADDGSSLAYSSALLCKFNVPDYYKTEIVPATLSAPELITSYGYDDILPITLTANNQNYDDFNASIAIYDYDENHIGTFYTLTGSNGGWLVDLVPGSYKAKIDLLGYEGVAQLIVYLRVLYPSMILAEDMVTVYGKEDYIIATLKTADGRELPGHNLTVEINGNTTVYTTNESSQIKIPVKGLPLNDNDIVIRFNESGRYGKSKLTVKVTVEKGSSQLTANDVTATYDVGDYLNVTLKDGFGNPIAGANLTVDLNGVKDYTTDENGTVKVFTKGLDVGTYNAKISFVSDNYDASFVNASVTITKGSSSISASLENATFRIYPDLVIKLVDSLGDPICGVQVQINFDGVGPAVTDENGTIRVSTEGWPAGSHSGTVCFIENGEYYGSEIPVDVMISSVLNFVQLNSTIANAVGDIVRLDHDAVFDGSTDSDFISGIVIDRPNLLIDGQGHVISGSDLSSIFNVAANNVTLYNVTLVHAKGAIDWNGANGTVNCSNFANHTGYEFAVINWYGENGVISNSYFTNNTATKDSAVWWSGANGLIKDSNFTDNHGLYGGAVSWFGEKGTVSGSYFADNSAMWQGGAIRWDGDEGTVNASTFVNNTVTEEDGDYGGGAISWAAEEGMIYGSNFINNTALYGGAINWNDGNGTIEDSNFTGNKADNYRNIYKRGYVSIDLKTCTLESLASINQIADSYLNDNATVIISFDDGTNIGCYSIVLCNNGIDLDYSSYNETGIYQFNLNNLAVGNYSISFYPFKGIDENVYDFNLDPMTFEVFKFSSSISLEPIGRVNVFDDIVVNFTVENRTSLSYEIKDSHGNIVKNGIINGNNLTVNGLGAGIYRINIFNAENDTFYGSSDSLTFDVLKIFPTITIDPIDDVFVGSDLVVNFNVDPIISLLYELKNASGDLVESGAIEDTNLILHNLPAGNYKITIFNNESDFYYRSGDSSNFTVMKYGSSVAIEPIADVYVDEPFVVNFNVTNRTELYYVITGADGHIVGIGPIWGDSLTIDGLAAGNYVMTISNQEDESHEYSSDSCNFTVVKYGSSLSINPISNLYVGSNLIVNFAVNNRTSISYVIKDAKGNVVKNGSVAGNNLSVSGLAAGSYNITIFNNENETYYGSIDSKAFTVYKYKTSITSSKVSAVYNTGKCLVATLKDEKGNLLKNMKVSIKVNGKTKTLKTNDYGKVKLNVSRLVPKTYTAKVSFAGNNKYLGASASVKVVIKKAKVKLTAKKKTFKRKTKVKKYKVTLKTNRKKAMKKVKLTLRVKGKTFKAKTNKKGKAVFKIKNLKKKGKFKAVIKYKGNKYYKKMTKKVRIRVK